MKKFGLKAKKYFSRTQKTFTKSKKYIGLVLLIIFIVICVWFREWSDWEKLADIGTFFTGVGVILAAWQLVFQERQSNKEQLQLSLDLSKQIREIEEKFTAIDDTNLVDQLIVVRDIMVFLRKVNLLVDNELIKLDELYIITGTPLIKLLGICLKLYGKYHGNPISLRANLSDDFFLAHRQSVINVYKALLKIDISVKIFEDELKTFERLKPRQEALGVLLKR